MPTNRAVVCLALLAVIGLLVAPVAATGGLTDEHDTDDDDSPSVSDEVSTFMQANTANAAHTVDDGIFASKFEKADDDRRAALIEERTATHESKLAELKAEYQELREQRDELHPSEYNARMNRITAELAGIDRSLGQTEQRARGAGVNVTELNTLRQNASELGGQEVAERAQKIAGIDPPRGPPDDAGPGDESPGTEQADAPGVGDDQTDDNRSNDGDTDRTGPPDDTPTSPNDGDDDVIDDDSEVGDEAKEQETTDDDDDDGDDDDSEPHADGSETGDE